MLWAVMALSNDGAVLVPAGGGSEVHVYGGSMYVAVSRDERHRACIYDFWRFSETASNEITGLRSEDPQYVPKYPKRRNKWHHDIYKQKPFHDIVDHTDTLITYRILHGARAVQKRNKKRSGRGHSYVDIVSSSICNYTDNSPPSRHKVLYIQIARAPRDSSTTSRSNSKIYEPCRLPSCCCNWTLTRSIKSLGSKTPFGGLNANKFGRLLNSTTTLPSSIRLNLISIVFDQQRQKIIFITLCGYLTVSTLRAESCCRIGAGRPWINSAATLYAASTSTFNVFLSNKCVSITNSTFNLITRNNIFTTSQLQPPAPKTKTNPITHTSILCVLDSMSTMQRIRTPNACYPDTTKNNSCA